MQRMNVSLLEAPTGTLEGEGYVSPFFKLRSYNEHIQTMDNEFSFKL